MIKIDWRKFIRSYMWFGFYFGGPNFYEWDEDRENLIQLSDWQVSNRIQDRFTPMRKYD